MYNFILDPLPEEYEGYKIDTDFKVGIQISMCLVDSELSYTERIYTSIGLLFENEDIDLKTAMDGLQWYMSGGRHKPKKSKLQEIEEEVNGVQQEQQGERIYDFDIDSSVIWSSFMKVYKIDLSKESMHWWSFMALLDDLGECAYNERIKIRAKRFDSQMSPQEKDYWTKAKALIAINEVEEDFTEEELKNYKEFLILNKGV